MKQEEKKAKVTNEKFTDNGDGTSVRTRTANWFECKLRYEKVMEDGMQKKVCEWFCVDAISFGEAEERVIAEMSAYISGSFDVDDIKKAKYHEVFFSVDPTDDYWFKAKVAFITIDEKTEKEKKSYVIYLVQAHSLERARQIVDKVMGGSMIDYDIKALSETQLMDLFEYKAEKFEVEEIDLVDSNMLDNLGKRLAKRVLKTWKEDFIDEDTKEVVQIERNEVVQERNTTLTEEVWASCIEAKVRKVYVYKNLK